MSLASPQLTPGFTPAADRGSERNAGTAYDPMLCNWSTKVMNLPAMIRRANTLKTRRSVKVGVCTCTGHWAEDGKEGEGGGGGAEEEAEREGGEE